MFTPNLRVLLIIAPLMGLLAVACGGDPTATPTATSVPTPTVQYLPTLGPIPTRTPTPTATPVPAGVAVTYVLGRWQMEDRLFQLRMGDATAFGYKAGDRISAKDGDGIVMTINLGDTITFTELNASTSRSSKPHHFTIAELGIDEERQPSQDAGFSFTPDKVGEFRIYDSEDPDAHGKAILIVK